MLTEDEKLLKDAKPSWLAIRPSLDDYESPYGPSPGMEGRSKDYPFLPILQKRGSIIAGAITTGLSGTGGNGVLLAISIQGKAGTLTVLATGTPTPLP